MSEANPRFDAYQPPAEPSKERTASDKTWGRIKIVCIICIILGALGLLSAMSAAAQLAFGAKMQAMFTPPQQSGMPEGMMEAQKGMQEGIIEVQNKYWYANLGITLFHCAVATGLLAGAIMCLRKNSTGVRLLLVACGVAILFEIVRAVVQTMLQMDTAKVTTEFMQKMAESGGGNGPSAQAGEMMATMVQVGVMVGVIFTLGLVLAKVIFYGISLRMLSRPAVAAAMESGA